MCILLGIEKIIELKWNSVDELNALILHELGHVYQAQYGVLSRELEDSSDRFLWQLFTEGIAMVFEQEVIGDKEYFHQDKDGWKNWCDKNIETITKDFNNDLTSMTQESQRYFGDWVRYNGRSDVGYYLGTRFVRFILESKEFDSIISFEIDDVKKCFEEFLKVIKVK